LHILKVKVINRSVSIDTDLLREAALLLFSLSLDAVEAALGVQTGVLCLLLLLLTL